MAGQPSDEECARLRLYIASDTPNSDAARANLRRVLEAAGAVKMELTIVDVGAEPAQAISDGVLVTPTLIKISQGRRRMIVGRLEPAELLQRFLFEG